MFMFTCEKCGMTFEKGRAKSSHVRWHHSNKTYSEEGLARAKEKAKVREERKNGKWVEEKIGCFKCGKSKKIRYREGRKKDKYFCYSCAHSRKLSNEVKSRIGESVKLAHPKTTYKKICFQCKEDYETIKRKQIYCSEKCAHDAQITRTDAKEVYEYQCNFDFNLADYPEEFDFSLIKKYGRYKAKNHGNNLDGISRDHMISVDYGWKNNISPETIKHPANCRLIRQTENSLKGRKSSITLEELILRIGNWNKKYNATIQIATHDAKETPQKF